jgi:hypothetical protein
MKKFIFLAWILFFFGTVSKAQDYKTGIGFRTGTSTGLTVKHFLSETSVIEGILATRWKGYNFTALYQINDQAFDTPGLNWFYGFGAHAGAYGGEVHPVLDDDEHHLLFGIDGIIGMEYSFKGIPFSISLDWKPGLDLIGGFYPWGNEVAFSVRYIFR